MHYEKKIQMLYKKRKDTDASVMLSVQLNISACDTIFTIISEASIENSIRLSVYCIILLHATTYIFVNKQALRK